MKTNVNSRSIWLSFSMIIGEIKNDQQNNAKVLTKDK